MKKISLLTLAFAALSVVSCKKDRTCTCSSSSSSVVVNTGANTSTILNGTNNSSNARTFVILKSKKSVARPNCLSSKITDVDVYGLGTSYELTTTFTKETTCTLK